MTDVTVTDEMLAAAFAATLYPGAEPSNAERERMRAALSAALPLVVAGERERQVHASERMRDEIHRIYEETGGPTDKLREAWSTYQAAIRADTGGE